MTRTYLIAALGAAAALARCVGGGRVTKDWTEESRMAARSGLVSMIDGTIQVVNAPRWMGSASASPARGSIGRRPVRALNSRRPS